MSDYANIWEVRQQAYHSQESDEPLLASLITRMSRLFDAEAGLPDGYFAEVDSDTAASSRNFYGDGTDYLRIDPYLQATAPTATMPTGWTVPSYIASNPLVTSPRLKQNAGEFFLVRVYGDDGARLSSYTDQPESFASESLSQVGWPAGIKVSISAKWGWLATPEEVRQAVIEMTVAAWRGRDVAFARATAIDGQVLFSDPLTARAREIARGYRQGRAMFA